MKPKSFPPTSTATNDVVDAHSHAVDGSLEGAGLVVAVAEDEHFLSGHHGAGAYGQGRSGHVVGVAAEEAGVGHAGIGRQCLLAGAACK